MSRKIELQTHLKSNDRDGMLDWCSIPNTSAYAASLRLSPGAAYPTNRAMRPDLHPRHHLADSADHDDHLTRLVASAQTHILACSSISELQAMQSILTELDNDTHGAIMALLQKKSNTEEAGASFSDMDFEAGASSTTAQISAVHTGAAGKESCRFEPQMSARAGAAGAAGAAGCSSEPPFAQRQWPPELIRQLTDLGFSRPESEQALSATECSTSTSTHVARAANYLLGVSG